MDSLPSGAIDIELSTLSRELMGDRTVLLLRGQQGSPTAVLKVARSPLEAAELRAQRRVLAELATHQMLDEGWRDLMPRILAFDERTDTTISVESYRPGMSLAEALVQDPGRAEELTAAALIAIAPLHHRTAAFVGVDNVCLLRRWVLEPLAVLADTCRRLDARLLPEVNLLRRLLRQDLFGWRQPVSWTHGSYTPGNVRVAGVQGPVTGIVNWGAARRGRLAVVDEYLLLLTVSCHVEQADFGRVVTDRLCAGGLVDRERNALRVARAAIDLRVGDETRGDRRLDERIAILLAWLHHVAESWRRRHTPPNQHAWCASNIAPVLGALAASHRFDGAPVRRNGHDG